MQLYEAIWRRKSIRQYINTPLSSEQQLLVQQSIERSTPLDFSGSVRIHIALDGEKVQKAMFGLVGAYGKVRSPHYLIVSAVPEGNYLENVGYKLEQVVLDLTSAGIATCWIGAHLNQQPVQEIVNLPGRHVPVLLVAYGLPAASTSVWRKNAAEFRRKQLSSLMLSAENESWADCLQAARLAPSAMNSQPWRFMVEDAKTMHVYQAKGGIIAGKLLNAVNKVDMGIALCHIKIASDHARQSVRLESRPAPDIAGCTYCISVTRE